MKVAFKRSRLWVDPPFQGRLLARMSWYILLYSLVVLHVGFLFDTMAQIAAHGLTGGLGQMYLGYLGRQTPLLFAFILTVPGLLYDLLKFSHRIAGPLFRCRRVMLDMAAGQRVPEFHPRRHDLMADLFQAFNQLITRSNAQQPAIRPDDPAVGTVAGEPEVVAKA